MNNCVAINIMSGGKVLNDRGVPLLFYWDGESNVKEQLKEREDFQNFLKKLVLNLDNYTSTTIAYFYFTENEDDFEEVYNDNVIVLQDWLTFADIDDVNFACMYVEGIMADLYKKVFDTTYVKHSKDELKDSLAYIYSSIKQKYAQRINKNTFIEYIRVELNKAENKLSKENMNWLFAKLNELFGNDPI